MGAAALCSIGAGLVEYPLLRPTSIPFAYIT